MSQTPQWLDIAIEGLLLAAVASQMAPSPAEGEATILIALDTFAEAVRVHGGDDRDYLDMMLKVCHFCITCRPDPADPILGLCVVDLDAGVQVADPDSAVRDDPDAAGLLSASRLIVAAAQDDASQFLALFDAVGETGTAPWVMIALVRTAGAMYVAKLKRTGTVPEELKASLAAREQAERDA